MARPAETIAADPRSREKAAADIGAQAIEKLLRMRVYGLPLSAWESGEVEDAHIALAKIRELLS